MQKNNNPSTLFRTPFSGAYWKQAIADSKSIRMLTVAALLIALPACSATATAWSAEISAWLIALTALPSLSVCLAKASVAPAKVTTRAIPVFFRA